MAKQKICDSRYCGKSILKDTAYRWGDHHLKIKKRKGRVIINGIRHRIYVCSERCYDAHLGTLHDIESSHDSGRFCDFATFWKDSDYASMTRGQRGSGRRKIGDTELAARQSRADWWADDSRLGSLQLDKLDPKTITHILDDLKDNDRTARTIMVYRNQLEMMLGDATYKEQIMLESTFLRLFGDGRHQPANVPVYQDEGSKNPTRKALNPDEIEKIKTFRRGTWEQRLAYAAGNLAVNCGLREGEIAGLKWKHFLGVDYEPDLNEPSFIYVEKQIDNKRVYRETKSDKVRFTKITNAPFVALVLKEWKSYQARIRMESYQIEDRDNSTWDEDFVFTSKDGRPTRPGGIYLAWKKECENAGLTWVRRRGARKGRVRDVEGTPNFHWLRNTWLSRLRQEFPDIPQEQIQEWSGHESPRMTFHYYDGSNFSLTPDQERRMNSLDEAAG